jgi:hypothetical protein
MTETKPYHRQEGEPNLWYDRFHKFMRMGAGRSLARCYQEISNAERSRQGRPLLPSTASCPGTWRQRAREFDWERRAEAWDKEQRRLDLESVQQARSMARSLSPDAIKVIEDTMRGELKNPDGTLTEGQNCTQRRLAAEKILNLVGMADQEPEEDEFEGPIKITEIRVHLADDTANHTDENQELLLSDK